MFWKKKISKTAKNTIIKIMVGWKGMGRHKPPPPKYATVHGSWTQTADLMGTGVCLL